MPTNILLVTVTKTETLAVLRAFREMTGQAPKRIEIDQKIYRDLGMINNMHLFMMRSKMGTSGPGGAQESVQKGIASISPQAVIMLGIAFGLNPAKQSIGDILVAEQLVLYDLQRVGTTSTGTIDIVPRGDRVTASPRLLDWLRSADEENDGVLGKVRFGLVLSGDKLIDNLDFRKQLIEREPEAIGGEMEGAGLYTACVDQKTDWVLVKGICDWADGRKEEQKEDRQQIAADNAARFVAYALNHAEFEHKAGSMGARPIISDAGEELPSKGRKQNHLKAVPGDGPYGGVPTATIINLSKSGPYYPPLVISVHGIRTLGEWQKVLGSVLSGSPTKVEPFYYGEYGLIRFLTPFNLFNDRMVNKFYRWYGDIIARYPTIDLENYQNRPSIVAHSFGSWIVAHAMLKHDDIRFDKIILAGSILPRDFDWMTLFARDQVALVHNECGQKDPWPRWAGRLVIRTGTGGFDGFDWFGRGINNVKSEWFGHSDSLMRQHIEKHWLPVLREPPSPLALLHGRNINELTQFSNILNHTGNVIDPEAYGKLPHYDEVEIPRGLSLNWIRVNPDIYTFLIDRSDKTPAGYMNAMPVEDELYQNIRKGKVRDNEVSDKNILPFLAGGTLKLYLMSIAVSEKYRRWGDGILQQANVQLITGFLDKLIYYAKNYNVRVTHFLATAWTPEGLRMCQFFSMEKIGVDMYGDSIFELDLEAVEKGSTRGISPAIKKLIKVYRDLQQPQ